MTASMRGGITALASALLALAAFLAHEMSIQVYVVAAVVAVGVCFFAAGWPRLLGVPAQRGSGVVIALAGLVGLAAAATAGGFRALNLVLAGGVIASFVHQMLRTDGRPRIVESLSSTVTGVIVVTLSAGWVSIVTRASQPEAGDHPVPMAIILVGACSLTAATIGGAFFPRRISPYLSPLFAGIAGAAIGILFPSVGLWAGAATGVGLGILYAGLHILFGLFPASGRYRPAIAAALLPVLSAGIVVYIVARTIATVVV
ncbi:hypothetical protein BSZ39_04990 [Bowdeniella nasicola]|uniref:Permease n=2 Tax=Bowdeniella nasicola TaxID=208480 RepID=A0A1Q5Q342_9ACTO|nr:hypothetical protein BSZ39_04990 [Bowdeniella nasicola]